MSLDAVFRLSVIVGMIDQMTGPMARINSTVDDSVSRIDKLNQSFAGMTKTGLVMAGIGAQITDAALAPVEATLETRRALGELAAMGVEDFATLETAARDFSDEWAGTTKAEFLRAAVDIKGGIDSLTDEGVAGFTDIAALTAKATGATAEQMTSLFATGYGIYKDYYDDLSDMEFGGMMSAGLAQAILVFKASGPELAAAIQSLGASATSASVPMEEQLAVLGQLMATMSGSEAGTKYNAFVKSAANAGKQLKLSFMDSNNQLLSMPEILETLNGKYGETIDAMEKQEIQKAFGTVEAVALIDLLYSKTDSLQGNILNLYDAMGQGTAVTREMAEAINATEPERYERLQQRIHNVTEEVGNMLLPTFNAFLDKGEQVVGKVSDWISKNQQLTKYIVLTVLSIGTLLAVAGTLVATIGGIGLIITKTIGIFTGFRVAMLASTSLLETMYLRALYAGDGLRAMGRGAISTLRALPGLIASVWSFNAALLANPVTWIVIGIVALVAAIILLWRNWDTVVAWLQKTWNSFVNGIVAGFNWVKNLFAGMPLWLQVAIAGFFPFIGIPMLIINNWGTIKQFFADLWNGVVTIFTGGIQRAKDTITAALTWFRESGTKVVSTFTDGIKSVINAPAETIKKGLAKVRELLPFSDAHEGPLSQLTLSGRRVFETIGTGMEQSQDIPAEMADKAFGQMGMDRGSEVNSISLREVMSERSDSSTLMQERENGTMIETLNISVDISKLKDLPALFKLLKEIEDYTNSNGATPAPAG
ncbi:phage tail tape measure protein [Paenibacillus sanguinis]|uniref:phage tail tape measure protein n=1 Tax=Paenibacillus sanguinis TaxID=225906 RepID=UPI000375CB63|nr:phage tail tape measure protein [Paenibacillus sanguinis]